MHHLAFFHAYKIIHVEKFILKANLNIVRQSILSKTLTLPLKTHSWTKSMTTPSWKIFLSSLKKTTTAEVSIEQDFCDFASQRESLQEMWFSWRRCILLAISGEKCWNLWIAASAEGSLTSVDLIFQVISISIFSCS